MMIEPAVKYAYVVILAVAFLISLTSFRAGLPFQWKLLALLLGLTFLVEVSIGYFFHLFHLKNNMPIYGPFDGLEFLIFGYFFYKLIVVKSLRWIVLLFLWIFPIFWLLTTLYIFKFQRWNTYVTVVGSFFIIVFVLMYYYQLLTAKEIQPIRNLPEFWIATGILMFHLWELPYFGTLNFFMGYYTAHLEVSNGLLNARMILDTLMYAFISYGYLCLILNTRKYSSS
jgi:hypothetical protein